MATFLDWDALSNPVLEYEEWSIKDFACTYRDGTFTVFFSAFYEDDGRVRAHVVAVRTGDFREYSDPILHLDGRADGWIGMGSPDVTGDGGSYYLTYNSWGDRAGRPNQLFYRVSEGTGEWGPRRPLARSLTRGTRAIDAAMTFAGGRCVVVWKDHEHRTRLATAASPDGEFAYRDPDDPYVTFETVGGDVRSRGYENYQFVTLDGERRLLATDFATGHRPTLFALDGDPGEGAAWYRWTGGRRLEVPVEEFNTGDRTNAAAAYDWRARDGHVYLLYAGNREGRYDGDTEGPFAGRGWNRLGLARSRDLVEWEVPGG